MTIKHFADRLAAALRLELGRETTRFDGLYDDWGLDSLQAFEMLVVIESFAGSLTPPAELPVIYTVEDAYDYYCALITSS